MSDMFITVFDTPDGAGKLAEALAPLRRDYALQVQDVTIVKRDAQGKISLETPGNVPLLQIAGGAFWGVMFGTIVTFPLAGAAVGAVVGAVTATDHDPGISSAFTDRLGETLKPGGSALCMLVRDVEAPELLDAVARAEVQGEVVTAPVPEPQAEELRGALAERAA